MDLRQYLSSKNFKWTEKRRPSGLQAVMNCPFCDDKEQKFAIDLNDGAFLCLHTNNCGKRGSFWDFQKLLGDDPKHIDGDYNFKIKTHTKKYDRPKKDSIKKADDSIIKYFEKRGINEKTVKEFKIVKGRNNSIAFPYFKGGELVNIKYRGLEEKSFWSEKNAEPVLYNCDMIDGNILHICEGEIDCMSLYEYGIKACSLPNGVNGLEWIENMWEWLEGFYHIILIMDMDEAGQEAVQKIAKRLGDWRCFTVMLPEKDVNECLLKKIDILDYISEAKDFKNPKIKNAGEFEKEIVELIGDKRNLYGVEMGWAGLQDLLKGWRSQEWTVWTGRNSSGKTTIINQIILDLAKHEEKICIISLEMKPKKLLRWMIMQYCGVSFIDSGHIKNTLSWLGKYLYLVDIQGIVKPDYLIDMFKYCSRKYGVTHFFIDNLIGIDIDKRYEYSEQKEFAKMINRFVQNYNSHVHLVAHPRKGLKDTDRPDKVDVSGTGDITNLAFNVIALYRPTEEEKEKAKGKKITLPDCMLYVKKNREWGREGRIDFRFEASTKRFIENKSDDEEIQTVMNPEYFHD